jgi:hypothetical protein
VTPSIDSVYEILSTEFGPVLASAGFTRVGGMRYPAWRSARDDNGKAIFLSADADAKATDPYAGGRFRIELEASRQQRPAAGLNGRALFFQLMTVPELHNVLAVQNLVIASLPKPPSDHVALYPEGAVRQQYLSYFQEQRTFDAVYCWLRYHSERDLIEWLKLLKPLIPPLTDRAAQYLSPDRRDLGKGYLLTT